MRGTSARRLCASPCFFSSPAFVDILSFIHRGDDESCSAVRAPVVDRRVAPSPPTFPRKLLQIPVGCFEFLQLNSRLRVRIPGGGGSSARRLHVLPSSTWVPSGFWVPKTCTYVSVQGLSRVYPPPPLFWGLHEEELMLWTLAARQG